MHEKLYNHYRSPCDEQYPFCKKRLFIGVWAFLWAMLYGIIWLAAKERGCSLQEIDYKEGAYCRGFCTICVVFFQCNTKFICVHTVHANNQLIEYKMYMHQWDSTGFGWTINLLALMIQEGGLRDWFCSHNRVSHCSQHHVGKAWLCRWKKNINLKLLYSINSF